jgi:hypothetical protein
MSPQPVKILADAQLTCFAYDGVQRIHGAMQERSCTYHCNMLHSFLQVHEALLNNIERCMTPQLVKIRSDL